MDLHIYHTEDGNVNLNMHHTVNMALVNYFCMQLPEIEEIDGQVKFELSKESAVLHVKDLTEYQ